MFHFAPWRAAAILALLAAAGTACAPPPPPAAPTAPTLPSPTDRAALGAISDVAVPTVTPSPAPSATPTAVPTATPVPTGTIDVRRWNGEGTVQVDGQSVEPGPLSVEVGSHQVALLVEGAVVEDRAVTVEAGNTLAVDLVVPPPLPPLAVVVENQADARPQSGLDRASVVYEMLAEGGITRFLAVFLEGDAPVVGPVRSLRHYFAFTAAEYNADLVHIGASPQGFAWRDAMDMGKLDESAGDPGVWRSGSRYAPHNAYTDTAIDRELLAARGRQQGRSWGPLHFGVPAELAGEPALSFSIGFYPSPYQVRFDWNEEQGVYDRFMEGLPHRDAVTGEQLTARSVVVQFAAVDPIPGDDKERVDIGLSESEGRLLLFTGGRVQEGTWRKGLPHEPTAWLDSAGNWLSLPRGNVWVEVVPMTGEVTW